MKEKYHNRCNSHFFVVGSKRITPHKYTEEILGVFTYQKDARKYANKLRTIKMYKIHHYFDIKIKVEKNES